MTVVVEAGATKSDWRYLDGTGERRVLLPGINVSTISMERNLEVLAEGLSAAGVPHLDGLYLYVAGIVTPQVRSEVLDFVRSKVSVGDFDIQDDLVAAARSVCGRSEGIVAILGTGSNACFWDGSGVNIGVRFGEYVTGDEGGGACLGKLFLGDYIKGLVPSDVADEYAASHDASYEGIVALVYRSEAPAGALGSLAPWLLERYGTSSYVRELIDGNFQSFIRRSLLRYDVARYPVGVVGGWGSACREIITRLCAEAGIQTGTFVAQPIDGLVRFHSV
jgi:N-acetylglucosamine kinase-like BadF-type ATPase